MFGEVLRNAARGGSADSKQDFEGDSKLNSQPVQVSEERSDVVRRPSTVNEPHRCVHDCWKGVEIPATGIDQNYEGYENLM